MEKIFFKVINRKRLIILDINPIQTIISAKEKVCELLRREKTEITLVYNGKVLLDEDNFIDKMKKCIYIYYEFKKSERKQKKYESMDILLLKELNRVQEAMTFSLKNQIENIKQQIDLKTDIMSKDLIIEILKERIKQLR